MQRIREAERGMIFDDYITRQGEIVTGTVQRVSNGTIFVNLGRTEGILPANEQVPGEKYKVNDRLKIFIMDVKKTTKDRRCSFPDHIRDWLKGCLSWKCLK